MSPDLTHTNVVMSHMLCELSLSLFSGAVFWAVVTALDSEMLELLTKGFGVGGAVGFLYPFAVPKIQTRALVCRGPGLGLQNCLLPRALLGMAPAALQHSTRSSPRSTHQALGLPPPPK